MWDCWAGCMVAIKTPKNFAILFNKINLEGFVNFKDDKGWNWANREGYPLNNERYRNIWFFTKDGFATFEDKKGYSWVNREGRELTNKRYKGASDILYGFASFWDNIGNGYINTNGIEFRSRRFTWNKESKENFQDNKSKLAEIEHAIYSVFPPDSMKLYIFLKIYQG